MDPRSAPVRERTDRCPGVLRLHEAADGRLARVRLPGGRIDARGLHAVADVASWGNGLVELTSRASVQIRGLGGGDGLRVAARLADGGLLPSVAHDRVRNVLASPLAGRLAASLMGVDELVGAIDRGLCADDGLAALPGRFLLAVDDGAGAVAWGRADVALVTEPLIPARPRAARPPGVSRGATATLPGDGSHADEPTACLRLWLAGSRTTLWAFAPDAPRLALDAARAFLALVGKEHEADRDPAPTFDRGAPRLEQHDVRVARAAWRVADLPDGPSRIARALGGALQPRADVAPPSLANELAGALAARPSRVAPREIAIGELAQADGRRALTVLPPLGRLDRAAIARLAELAGEVRLSTARTLTCLDLTPGEAAALRGELASLGLVTTAGSGWQGLSACAGLGACASALVDVRAAATARAAVRGAGAAGEHWSACGRGCGRPAGVPVSVVAGADGVRVEMADGSSRPAGVAAALALLVGRT